MNKIRLGTIEEEEKACRKAWARSKATHTWHCHHERLLEELTEPAKNRIDYIVRTKPEGERALRLRLFRPMSAKAVKATASARKAYDEALASAWKAYDKALASARKAYDEARAPAWKAYDKATASAWKAYDKATASARKAYDEATASARKAYDEATASAWKAYDKALAPAHRAECDPACPWNGSTIFP